MCFLNNTRNVPSPTCAQDRAENSMPKSRRSMTLSPSYSSGFYTMSASGKKRNNAQTDATHTLAYFRTSSFSFSAPFNTLRMSWTQPSPDNFTRATPAKIGEWKRRSSAASTFSDTDNHIHETACSLRICNTKTSQKPVMYSKNAIKRWSSHRSSRAWLWMLLRARIIVFFGTDQDYNHYQG